MNLNVPGWLNTENKGLLLKEPSANFYGLKEDVAKVYGYWPVLIRIREN